MVTLLSCFDTAIALNCFQKSEHRADIITTNDDFMPHSIWQIKAPSYFPFLFIIHDSAEYHQFTYVSQFNVLRESIFEMSELKIAHIFHSLTCI